MLMTNDKDVGIRQLGVFCVIELGEILKAKVSSCWLYAERKLGIVEMGISCLQRGARLGK